MIFTIRHDGDCEGERVEADDAADACVKFMELIVESGDLGEWVENGNQIELSAQADGGEMENMTVCVDWSPDFTAYMRTERR